MLGVVNVDGRHAWEPYPGAGKDFSPPPEATITLSTP